MLVIGSILLLMVIVYIGFFTPYPFVWLLRSQKEAYRDKVPENIHELKQNCTIQTKLSYPSNYPKSTFDWYVDKTRPVKGIVVWVHGGSFIAGSSEGMNNYGVMLAHQGYGVCAINYALAPAYPFPNQIKQLDAFCAYLPSFLDKEKISYNCLFLGGDSAGGNLAASYACMTNDVTLAKKANVNIQNTKQISGLLLYCAPYDFCEDLNDASFEKFKKFFKYIGWSYLKHRDWAQREEKWLASPIYHVNADYPAVYLCDGKQFSFLWQARKFEEACKKHQIPVRADFFEHLGHEFQFDFKQYKEAMIVAEHSYDFLDEITGKESLC